MNEIRGVVLEINGLKAHILTNSGDFIVCDTNQIKAQIGEEVVIGVKVQEDNLIPFQAPSTDRKSFSFQKWVIAATFLMAVLGGTWFYPTDWVYLEINPSIAMKINMYDRVIGYEGLNQDGEKVASGVNSYGQTVEKAIDESMNEIAKDGFMTAEKKNAVIIGYGSEKAKKKASTQIDHFVKKSKLPTTVASISLQSDTIETAKTEAISPINLEIAKKNKKLKKSDWVKEVKRMEKLKTIEIIDSNKGDQTVEVTSTPAPESGLPLMPPAGVDSSVTEGVQSDQILSNQLEQPLINQNDKLKNNHKTIQPEKKNKPENLIKPSKLDKPVKPDKPDKPDKSIRPDKPDKPDKLDKPTKPDKPVKPVNPLKKDRPTKAPYLEGLDNTGQEKQAVSDGLTGKTALSDAPEKEPLFLNPENPQPSDEKSEGLSAINGKVKDKIQSLENQIEEIESEIDRLESSDLKKNEKKVRITVLKQRVKVLEKQLKALKNE